MYRLSQNELLTPVPPFQAYADDVERLGGHAPIGPDDDAWLLLAQTLSRAASGSRDARGAVLTAGGEIIAGARAEAIPSALGEAMILAAEALQGYHVPGPNAAADRIVETTREVVAAQERAGAFRLAFTTLGALREALAPLLDARSRGLLLAQQGRAARQLGALATAASLYEEAARNARSGQAADVAARAFLGLGVLANMRGNYPESRRLFKRALGAAKRSDVAELRRAARHGLLIGALAARDVDTALEHGWAAMLETPPGANDEQAEILVNLANVGRIAGEHRASLGASLRALEISTGPRLCLPALSTAAVAAARLGERRLLDHLAREAERIGERAGQPFERANTLVALAEAYALLGDPKAFELADQAQAAGKANGFFEIVSRAEEVRRGREAASDAAAARRPSHDVASRTAVRSTRARAVVRSLEALSEDRLMVEVPC